MPEVAETSGVAPALQLLERIEQERLRRAYKQDPVRWARERLGDHLWSKQREIIESVRDERHTAVMSCHQIGKSYIAAITAAWWLDVHPVGEAFVVTSAPSAQQVRAILWREIGRCHARGKLRGRLNQTEWFMAAPGGREELVAFGRKPDDYDPAAFQGIHARYVLFLLDEACGIVGDLWEAGESLIANDLSKALAIGNPDDPETEFYQICQPGSGWRVVQVGAFDTPNLTGEEVPRKVADNLIGRRYIEDRRKRLAPRWFWVNAQGNPCPWQEGVRVVCPEGVDPTDTNPYWQSKILGLFPPTGDSAGLIPMAWVRAAQRRELPAEGPRRLGVDVGGGGDASCGCLKQGGVFRIKWEDRNPDTMQTAGKVAAALKGLGPGWESAPADVANVDHVGMGRGVYDRLVEQDLAVVAIGTGEKAFDEKAFANRRSELGWQLRTLFEIGAVDIDEFDEELASQLVSLRYKRTSNGRIQLETKDEAKRRQVPSPNRADAMMLANAEPRPKIRRATWGRS